MSTTLLFETKSVLRELGRLRESVRVLCENCSDYEPFMLIDSYRKGSSKRYYYLRQKGRKGSRYLGNDSHKAVSDIKSARYYKQLLQVIEKDMQLLEAIDREYVIPDHDSINRLLPKVYRSSFPPEIMNMSAEAKEWKKRMEERKAKHKPYRPEDLVHEALDGTKMRSLSEVTIANYLLSLGITFVYELPMTINGRTVLPDFTILSPVDNKTVIIIEHQGAMDSESYQAKFIRTVLFYLGTGLVPNKDVFFTFNHLDRHLDLKQIDCILHIAFGYTTQRPLGAT